MGQRPPCMSVERKRGSKLSDPIEVKREKEERERHWRWRIGKGTIGETDRKKQGARPRLPTGE